MTYAMEEYADDLAVARLANPGSWYMGATFSPAASRWRMTVMTWRLARWLH
jgi:hypothetical protein